MGKSFLAQALGYCAVRAGRTLRFVHAAGRTAICRVCGNTIEFDHAGHHHSPPENPDHFHGNPTFGPLSYPLRLACTRITLHKHSSNLRILDLTVTPSHPVGTVDFLVYHQPFRQPNLSLRDVRIRSNPTVRYVYAVEMTPYDAALANPLSRQHRQLKTLILKEACAISGYTLREGRRPWALCAPGTILATPLAPAR